jgi:hypothetical protein
MKFTVHALLLTAALGATQAYAACDYPVAPGKFPDGNTATKEEMISARKDVSKYNDDMTKYLECIKAEYDAKVAAMPDLKPEAKADMDKKEAQKEDAAVKEVTDVVARFEEQRKVWVAKHPKPAN